MQVCWIASHKLMTQYFKTNCVYNLYFILMHRLECLIYLVKLLDDNIKCILFKYLTCKQGRKMVTNCY